MGNAEPLRIVRVEIENFRGIRELSLDFTAGATPLDRVVLAGPNGGGKTAVLEAILLGLRQHPLLAEDAAPFAQQVRFGASDFKIRVHTEVGSTRDQHSVSAAMLTAAQRSEGFGAPFQGLVIDLDPDLISRSYLPQIDYHSARREPEGLGTQTPSRGRSEREARRVVELKRWLVALRNRALTKRQSPDASSPFARLQRFWQSFTGDSRVFDVIERGGDGADAPDAEVVLRDAERPIPDDVISLAQARVLAPSRSDVPSMVPLDRLSSGQMALLTLAGSLLFRDRPLDVLLIDEPEQHLHAGWHAHIVDALRRLSPTTQIIVATHSADVLSAALSVERFILGPNGTYEGAGIDALADAVDERDDDEAAQ